MRAARRDRMRYWVDDYMSRGSRSTFTALTIAFLVSLVFVAVFRILALKFLGDVAVERGASSWRQVYITFLELTDPGSMTQDVDSSPWVKVFAVASGLLGLVLLSSLIALLTTTVDGRLKELRKGHSKVVLSGHTLILGWNDRVLDIIGELVLANESEECASVVLLADRPKEEMDDFLALNLGDTKTTKVVTRSGPTSALVNLGIVAAGQCKSIIVLASCNVGADTRVKAFSDLEVIKTLLAVTTSLEQGQHLPIVAEVFGETERDLARAIDEENVICVNADDVLAKIVVQTSRSSGLALVYEEMLSFDGAELYFFAADWGGATFGEVMYRFPDGVVIGYRHETTIEINGDHNMVLGVGTEVIILASDDSAIEFLDEPAVDVVPTKRLPRRVERHIENQLIIGFSAKLETIASEYSGYVLDGSTIDVVLRQASPDVRREVERIDAQLPTMTIRVVSEDAVSAEALLSLRPFEYDNIIILSQAAGDGGEDWTDSETLVILLQLQRIFRGRPESSRTKLVAEILDSRNRELVARTGVNEFIISNSLISMMVAQISENGLIKSVYDDLFAEAGSEIYLKPANLYFEELPTRVQFAEVMNAAQARGEIAIGVKDLQHEDDAGRRFGVALIPPKDSWIDLREGDTIVVVSEDET